MAFVAIHLGAWNYHFKSVPDKWLWRSSSIVSYVFTFLMILFSPYMAPKPKRKDDDIESTDTKSKVTEADDTELDDKKASENLSKPLQAIAYIISACYFWSHVTLIVLACTAFSKAPVGVYKEGSWTTFPPHL